MFSLQLPPPEILSFIEKNSCFIIAGHKEPDGDCVGSQLALASALRRLGKDVLLCQAGPWKRREILQYEKCFLQRVDAGALKNPVAVIVDCSSAERIGSLAEIIAGLPLAIIDHHEPKRTEAVKYIDSNSPASVVLVYSLIKALGLEILKKEAEFLFLGLCTDSGFFRHLDSDDSEALYVAAQLVKAGGSPKKTFELISGGKSLDSRRLLGAMLSRVEAFFDGKLLITTEEFKETELYGLESRDSDSLYQLLFAVAGVEAVAVIRQESAENCTVGLRSKDSLDVAEIASALGGGGHKNASGLKAEGSINETREILLLEFEKVILKRR